MKIEELILQHLYNAKKVTFQGIGTIRLEENPEPGAAGNVFTFEYDLKAPEDDALIDFIVQQTKKMKPLASADLDSYLILAKQFLNIGNPLVIEGVGSIQKTGTGQYGFIPGQFVTPKIDDIPRQVREKRDETVSFESKKNEPNHSRRNLLLGISVLVIILLGLTTYYFLSTKKIPAVLQEPVTDTSYVDTTKKNMVATADTLQELLQTDSNTTFSIVFNEYTSREEAKNSFSKYPTYKNKFVIISGDSIYKLAMPFKTPLSDTLRARDSLRKIFGDDLYVELKK